MGSVKDDAARQQFFALMARYCALARLLPSLVALERDGGVTDAKLVLAELEKTQAEMDALLDLQR